MKWRKKAFTLVELLVVIVVIAILSMLIFKLMGYGARSAGKAQTMALLLAISQALEEFKAAYGIYPPATEPTPPFPFSGRNLAVVKNTQFGFPSKGNEFFSSLDHEKFVEDYFAKNPNATTPIVYYYGLYGYLLGETRGFLENIKQCKKLSSKDIEIRNRWKNYLNERITQNLLWYDAYPVNVKMSVLGMNIEFKLQGIGFFDSWSSDLFYQCLPPYQTYKLFSAGPDKIYGNDDDIHGTMKWDTK